VSRLIGRLYRILPLFKNFGSHIFGMPFLPSKTGKQITYARSLLIS
jgi:hypothetical protein